MFNRKSARQSAFAALVALGALAAGSAHAGNVQWSVAVNLPVPVPVIGVPVYHAPAPVYYPPVPAPVVVYRPAPPVVYGPVPVVDYRGWDRRHHHHHHHRHGHRDGRWDDRGYGDRGYGDRDRDDRGGRWEPGPRVRHHGN